jgi:hypothetical protein
MMKAYLIDTNQKFISAIEISGLNDVKKALSELHVEKRSETSQTRSTLAFKVITKNPATARLCGWRNT